MDFSFFRDKNVLITGHTCFKGSWMCRLLLQHGACVIGYALDPPMDPALFDILDIEKDITHYKGDVYSE